MTQNVIIIENLRTGRIVIPVENFSDDNIKEAISKNLHKDVIHPVNDLQCLNADTDSSIYAVNNAFLGIKKNIDSTAPFYYNNKYDCKVRVSYATMK